MSRRIFLCMLAALATLIATQASADRECFEGLCRLPEVVEPPAPPAQPPIVEETAAPKLGVQHNDVQAQAVPDKAVEQDPARPAAQIPLRAESPRVRSVPASPVQRDPSERLAPARIQAVVDRPAQIETKSGLALMTVVGPSQVRSGQAVVVNVPGAIYPDGAVVPAYPYQRHESAWNLCQSERRVGGHATANCGPYSYHPYGIFGHRPNGTYSEHRSVPSYAIAPNAKVISIDTSD
jgi:hypothetical protein